jgi:hypothetical protein
MSRRTAPINKQKMRKKQKRSALGDKDANRSPGGGGGQRGNDEEGLKM